MVQECNEEYDPLDRQELAICQLVLKIENFFVIVFKSTRNLYNFVLVNRNIQ